MIAAVGFVTLHCRLNLNPVDQNLAKVHRRGCHVVALPASISLLTTLTLKIFNVLLFLKFQLGDLVNFFGLYFEPNFQNLIY